MSAFLEVPRTPRGKSSLHDGDSDDDGNIVGQALPMVSERKSWDESGGGKHNSSLLDPGAFRRLSTSPFSEDGHLPGAPGRARPLSPAAQPLSWRDKFAASWRRFWAEYRGVVLVALSQLFASLMNMCTRLLELEGAGMHPFQIVFLRMSVTTTLSSAYMYWMSVPHFPFGSKDVRLLLVARGCCGFFGIYGMWYSMMYLPLAEATVITFLVPSVSGYMCHLILHDPFTRKEQIASFIALAGVILIAHPTSLFSAVSSSSSTAASPVDGLDVATNMTQSSHRPAIGEEATPAQRLSAIGVALLGVLGGSGAFTTIRWIGKRAHPLISVNYFSTSCTIVSSAVLALAPVLGVGQPDLRFGFPDAARQWALLLLICVCGFVTQFMLTAGLGGERSNRATAMTYTHMLFAAGFDRWVFGHQMGVVSLVGCGLIIGSALWAALTKREAGKVAVAEDVEMTTSMVERVPMLRHGVPGEGGDEEDSEEEESISLDSLEPVRYDERPRP